MVGLFLLQSRRRDEFDGLATSSHLVHRSLLLCAACVLFRAWIWLDKEGRFS